MKLSAAALTGLKREARDDLIDSGVQAQADLGEVGREPLDHRETEKRRMDDA